ncbi:MAG: allophanate hydrolase [Thiogranum sp.]|nr:allophanate hydrolase [Thiogranum sp.]
MSDAARSLDIQALLTGYREARFTPQDIINEVLQRIAGAPERNVWIELLTAQQLQGYLDAHEGRSVDELPLYGVPFAIKDNIDLAGAPTTAGCAEYAYTPGEHAFVVQRLIDAGAIPIGKTNLDQFATGLVGTRSPFGACRNSFDPEYISGGSSSGSAVAVATGQVSFALGTDTAGSGRVPAAFNNIVGIKPTRGLLSTRGVVPACRSLDCVSVFALTTDDAEHVLGVAAQFDEQDAYARQPRAGIPSFSSARFRFGVPRAEQLEFFGNREAAVLFRGAVGRLAELGGIAVELDFGPFLGAARLLYEGPWVSERYAAIEAFIERQPEAMLAVTREIVGAGNQPRALDTFKAQYRLMEYRRRCERVWSEVDVILTPTAGTIYRIDAVNGDPVRLNSNLGYYTNFMNLLDLSGIAVPAGFQSDGLPFGITLFAPAFADASLAALGDRVHRSAGVPAGATGLALPAALASRPPVPGIVPIAVCGAHLSGLPLNTQLVERGAWLMERTRTSANYRLYALPGGPPRRPGLVRDVHSDAIEVEVWAMPAHQVGGFLQLIPAPLGLGKVELADGEWVTGFICEPGGIDGATDISAFGGWRAWLDSQA